MVKTFDARCYELAEHFLDEYADPRVEDIEKLAREIQGAIEDWLQEYAEVYYQRKMAK